jgi:uncharacterized protein involved in exopolysaccharide biosynthesis
MDSEDSRSNLSRFPRLKRILLWSNKKDHRGNRYFFSVVLALVCIWLPAAAFIMLSEPTYTSSWSIILPGKGAGGSVNLADIGQASTMASSPYGSPTISPKVNYKELISSPTVIYSAAAKLGITGRQFGKPRVKLVDQTSLIYLNITGNTPAITQAKASALQQSLTELLDRLRSDEIDRRADGFDKMLLVFQEKLQQTRDALLEFQVSSNIVTVEQFERVALSIEELRLQHENSQAELEELRGQVSQLTQSLGLSAQQANDALILQNDQVFQASLADYTDAQLLLSTHTSKWGVNHPEVRKERARQTSAIAAMSKRLQQLLMGRNGDIIELLRLGKDRTRNALFQDLISLNAKQRGLQEKCRELARQVDQKEIRLSKLSGDAAKLDDLERNHQLAEAVFTSSLARIDTGKADIYVSYPLIQVLDPPNLPAVVTSPNASLVIVGATVGSTFTIAGLVLMWKRKPYIQKILKSASSGTA